MGISACYSRTSVRNYRKIFYFFLRSKHVSTFLIIWKEFDWNFEFHLKLNLEIGWKFVKNLQATKFYNWLQDEVCLKVTKICVQHQKVLLRLHHQVFFFSRKIYEFILWTIFFIFKFLKTIYGHILILIQLKFVVFFGF